ncbi:MAG: hypothetical protein V1659_02350 [Candidatus Woesearchaeota archaeon]
MVFSVGWNSGFEPQCGCSPHTTRRPLRRHRRHARGEAAGADGLFEKKEVPSCPAEPRESGGSPLQNAETHAKPMPAQRFIPPPQLEIHPPIDYAGAYFVLHHNGRPAYALAVCDFQTRPESSLAEFLGLGGDTVFSHLMKHDIYEHLFFKAVLLRFLDDPKQLRARIHKELTVSDKIRGTRADPVRTQVYASRTGLDTCLIALEPDEFPPNHPDRKKSMDLIARAWEDLGGRFHRQPWERRSEERRERISRVKVYDGWF